MSIRIDGARVLLDAKRPRMAVSRLGFALIGIAAESALIVILAVATGVVYHLMAYDRAGLWPQYAEIGLLIALLFSVPALLREEQSAEELAAGRRTPSRMFLLWNYAFLFLLLLGLLTKTTAQFSRGWLFSFYAVGLGGVVCFEVLMARLHGLLVVRERVASRRMMLVGQGETFQRMLRDESLTRSGLRIVAVVDLPLTGADADLSRPSDCAALDTALDAAVEKARDLGVEDVVIQADWAAGAAITHIVEGFTVLPVAVHLATSEFIGRFARARVSRFGRTSAVSLTAPPLSQMQLALKRAFDLVVGATALVMLSPLLAVLAILIKRDSAGPVFFRQRRRGYNLREFRIWKFRTMTTLDDGDVIAQAEAGDARVTRIGAWLRAYNLDELPQLFNVICGEMSLVGPRPHAVAHDRLFETRIARYGRRLNVKPGITGWAQVNGLRGIIDSEAAMRARVAHDLYYVDNRSIAFDISILALTVVSPKAYRNAL